ncbi:hypothetical protein MMC26_006516 [Xylographa opegraphella]|nr:hypothetical protein [Xylographa opegraphella]
MAFWPFGRKKRKTNAQGDSNMAIARAKNPSDARVELGRPTTDVNARASSKSVRKNSQRRPRTPSKVLTKAAPPRTRDLEKTTSVPPVPVLPRPAHEVPEQFNEKFTGPTYAGQSRQPLAAMPTNQADTETYYFQNPTSQTSIQAEKFDFIPVVPTLQGKRNVHDKNLPRRKSSKRKAEDQVREQEIKALSSPIPIPKRPQPHGAGLLTRESKRIPGGLNRNLQRPLSEVSLPLQDSLHSSNSGMPDSHAFKVSAFDALSPRPTIKYSENPRWTPGASNLGASRTSTRKDKRPSLPGDVVNARARVDDLADELDAGSLREVMERDRRRRESKRKSDHEKLQRRLQRRAEKQKIESRAEQTAPAPNAGLPGDGLGLEVSELPVQQSDTPMLEATSGREEAKSPDSWLDDASRDNQAMENPFDDRMGASHLEPPTPEEKDEPVIETAKAVRLSAASMSPPLSPVRAHARGPSNLSTLDDLASRSTPDVGEKLRPEDARRGSDSSSRLASSWTSFFRRSGTRGARNSSERGRATPSEFSNTSRESFARQAPPPVFIRNVRERSGTPVRTQSKFREDLPELPISPPVSRVQSPELVGSSPYIDHASKLPVIGDATAESAPRLSDVHPAYREEVAQSIRGASPDLPITNIMSQSMASVDSEGSWLSGRPPKRSSQQLNPLRTSGGSLTQNLPEEQSNTDEDGGAMEGSSLNRGISSPLGAYVPGYFTAQINARGTPAGDESDYEEAATSPEATPAEEAPKMSSVVGRHPTIVRRSMRAKSREGLLDDFGMDESPTSSPSADSPIDPLSRVRDAQKEGSSIHRATSVDLGKTGHARHISAGSARLLDLPPRSSTEQKRLSTGSGERSPLRAAYDGADTAPRD